MSEENQNVSGAEVEAAAPVAEQYHDESGAQAERQVPLAALEAERSQRQQLQDELKMIKEHLSLMQGRQQQPSQPQESQYHKDDVMTFGDFEKVASKFQKEVKMSLEELQMAKRHPDYEEVVQKYLPDVLKRSPKLAAYLNETQDFATAYDLAKSSSGYLRDHSQKQQSADAERIMQNTQRPGSASAMGGTSPINMAKRYKDMSDDEFRREMTKNLGYA